MEYWELYEEKAKELFGYQVRTSLLSNYEYMDKDSLIKALCDKAEYLISQRGYSAFIYNY
jgi:hypothetical protein